MNVNPKIVAALVVALVAIAGNAVAILGDAYPDNPWVRIAAMTVSGLAPVVAGYAKSQGDWQPK